MEELVNLEDFLKVGSLYFCEDYHIYRYKTNEEVMNPNGYCGHSSTRATLKAVEKLLINIHGYLPDMLYPEQPFLITNTLPVRSGGAGGGISIHPIQILAEEKVSWIKVHNLMSIKKILWHIK